MGYPASERIHHTPALYESPPPSSGVGLKVLAVFLGLAVAVMGVFSFWLAVSAQRARDDARKASASAAGAAPAAASTMDMDHSAPAAAAGQGSVASPSFAGLAPANADKLAAAHKPFAAELPAAQPGPVVHVNLSISHETMQIAPGIKYQAWTFGNGAPGPVIHVRQGQLVKVTMRNTGQMPHSIDFHAARVAPNKAFVDIAPGKSFTFSFRANDPGVFMYHCGTKPVLAHIANGMYGAIVVDPKDTSLLPPVHHGYVLVASEWYLNSPGLKSPASLDMTKANQVTPDWVTWNGYAAQYVVHPLEAHPGHTVRFYVVDAGPSLNTDFHVVGTVLDRAWVDGAVTDPPEHGVQTVTVPAGGGAIFDVTIDRPGLYPFVSHSFASVNMGQVGLLNVGDVDGTMSH